MFEQFATTRTGRRKHGGRKFLILDQGEEYVEKYQNTPKVVVADQADSKHEGLL